MTARSRRTLALVVFLALLGLAVWGVPRWQAAQAERDRQAREQARQAETARMMNSDPVKFQVYVRQVAIAAQVIGTDEQDASGPCATVSGFENGVGDPPPETRSCVITDSGTEPPTVQLTLKDGRVFHWPSP